MRKAFAPLVAVVAVLFASAPYFIAQAPYESTMGLIQKIMYFHVPSWIGMYTAIFVCGIASAIYLFKNNAAADRYAAASAELAVVFGLMGLVTGPLWGRKAWGVWWEWDVRLTSALLLELVFVGILLVRKYGGPGSRSSPRRRRSSGSRWRRSSTSRSTSGEPSTLRPSCRRCRK